MKKTKRILSGLLALTMLIGIKAPARAADSVQDSPKLSISVSTDEVKIDNPTTVTIRAEEDFTTGGSGTTIYYDATALTPDLENSTTEAPFKIYGPVEIKGKTALRVCFPPWLGSMAKFEKDQVLATIFFHQKAGLTTEKQVEIVMEEVHLYDEKMETIPTTVPEKIPVTVTPPPVPATGVQISLTSKKLEEGDTVKLTATVVPENAADKTVVWRSLNESVATVSEKGVVTAVSVGTAKILAITNDGQYVASCEVTVIPPDAGYTVAMADDQSVTVGGTVIIPVTVSNTDEKTGYNAFDMQFAYDASALELISTEIEGLTVSTGSGTVKVMGYGDSRNVGSTPFSLEFKLLKPETAEVKLTSARVDKSANAMAKNASVATMIDDTTVVKAAGYAVTLPENFQGETTADPGEDYTFRAPDDYYEYTITAVKVSGKTVTTVSDGKGGYTIAGKDVTGPIEITATKAGKIYRVTLGTDMTGAATAQHGTKYTATLTKASGYTYDVTVIIGGKAYTGYKIDGTKYEIPGEDIVGDILFAVSKTGTSSGGTSSGGTSSGSTSSGSTSSGSTSSGSTSSGSTSSGSTSSGSTSSGSTGSGSSSSGSTSSGSTSSGTTSTSNNKTYTVTITGGAAGAAQGSASSVGHGKTYILRLTPEAGFRYVVHYTIGSGNPVEIRPAADNTCAIRNITGPLSITVEKVLDAKLTVEPYVSLNGKRAYLIRMDEDPGEGKVFTYDGELMYYSEAYNSWVYLLLTNTEPDPESIYAQIQSTSQFKQIVKSVANDVNQDGQVNVSDIKLVYDLYNAKYSNFEQATVLDFLHADVNADGKLDVRDAAAVVYGMLNKEGE